MSGLWSQPGVPHEAWRCIGVAAVRPPEGGDCQYATCDTRLNEQPYISPEANLIRLTS